MISEQVGSCPACGGKSLRPFIQATDYTTSHQLFHVEQCDGCKLLITNPRPPEENASSYYLSEDYISHNDKAKGLFSRIYLSIRYLAIRWKISLIQKSQPAGSILDFGCGTGEFLQACKYKGIITTGVEPSSAARQIAQSKGLNVHASIDQITGLFDVITLWHVLEHIYALPETLEKLKSRLKQNGTIFIAVPNWESHDATFYRENWAAYDVPRHVWHFSPESMKTLLSKHGLRYTSAIPMKLDAYYVSMLSEKYKAHSKHILPGIFRAFYHAIKSNYLASNTGQYSSLIYVVVHES